MTVRWIPDSNPDHVIELDSNGNPKRIIRGRKNMSAILKEHFESELADVSKPDINQTYFDNMKSRYKF